MNNFPILSLLTFLPILGMVIVLLLTKEARTFNQGYHAHRNGNTNCSINSIIDEL